MKKANPSGRCGSFRILLRVVLGCLLLCGVGILCGCWDNAEINGRAFVLGFGVDAADSPVSDGEDRYDFTFQLAVPVSGESDEAGAMEYMNCTVTERSPAAAIRLLERNLGRQVNFEQLNLILFGEDLSHQSFIGLTELFFRRASVRRQSSVAVCRGSAKDFFAAGPDTHAIATDASVALQNYDGKGRSDGVTMNLHSLFKVLSNRDEFYLLRMAAVTPEDMENTVSTGFAVDDGEKPRMLAIVGAAAYGRSGGYRGELDGEEIEWLRLAVGRQMGGMMKTVDPKSGRTAFYQIQQSDCEVKCGVEKGIPWFTLHWQVRCLPSDIGDIFYGSGTSENPSAPDTEQMLEETLTAQFTALTGKSQRELGASVLGLQDLTRQRMPDWYEANEKQWETLYARARVEIRVDCTLCGGGITR